VSDAAQTAEPTRADFSTLVMEQLSDQEKAGLIRSLWVDRLTSAWAPVTVFGIFFALYLIVIENALCTYLWLQPALKGFGLLMVVWWAGLLMSRFVAPAFAAQRKARVAGQELFGEIAERARAPTVKDRDKKELAEISAVMLRATIGTDPDAVRTAAEKVTAQADKSIGKNKRGAAGDFLGGFGKALLVALAIRTVLIEPFRIPSGSMIPTLEIGDQIFVNKFIYGVRIPFTNFVPFVIVRKPERGDVIVFNNPVQPDKDFVKRIVGIPGDEVELKDKVVYLNGKPVPTTVEHPAYKYMDERGQWVELEAALSRETLDGTQHYTLRETVDPTGMHEGPYTVPEGAVFVMGDNRDNSEDSRYGLGGGRNLGVQFVPYGNIKGKAMVIWISFSHGGLFSNLFGGTGLRADRFFQPVGLCGTEPRRP
jgi:signal peptidase I